MSSQYPETNQPGAPQEDFHLPPVEISKNLAAEMLATLDEAITKKEITLGRAFHLFTEMDTLISLKHCTDPVAVKIINVLKKYKEPAENGNINVVDAEAFSIFKTELFKNFHNNADWADKLRGFFAN